MTTIWLEASADTWLLYFPHRVIGLRRGNLFCRICRQIKMIFSWYRSNNVKFSLIEHYVFFVNTVVSAKCNLTCYLRNEFDEGSIDRAVKRRCAYALWLIISPHLLAVLNRHLMKYSELEHRRIRDRPEPVLITNHRRHCARIIKNYSPLLQTPGLQFYLLNLTL